MYIVPKQMIEIYNKLTGELETIKSYPTSTPHFVITHPLCNPELDVSDMYNVTHVRSSALALGPFKDLDVARICAAVMGSLPIPWDDFSMAVSTQYKNPDPEQEKRFRAAWVSLPLEIHKWRKAVANACILGDL